MPELIANCPRCGSQKITFDVKAAHVIDIEYKWKHWYEVFCVCRGCSRTITYILTDKTLGSHEQVTKVGLMKIDVALNQYMNIERYISLRDRVGVTPPEHLPDKIANAFNEGATCLAVNCWNAAGTMFRLCLDHATRPLLPPEIVGQNNPQGLNKNVRRSLGLRMQWLFNNGGLPEALRELSTCVKDDGNDGAHAGTLGKEDAEDLLDFTTVLLERLYTEPERLKIAAARRGDRRKKK